jgi:signal transduction histidine kinase
LAAIGVLVAATFVAGRFMGLSLPAPALYPIAAVLLAYNFVLYDLLRYWTWAGREPSHRRIGRLLTCQISADLLILATILHFSGGIENPFLFFFAFRMMIASILRSRRQSYFQATPAVLLFGGLVVLEPAGALDHYGLEGFAGHMLYQDWRFVFGTLFVFTVTLYLLVYLTTSIGEQLRQQQEDYENANTQLHAKNRLKNEYVLRLTHDIKGHLAAVQRCLEIVFSEMVGPLNERQKDLVERAYRRASQCLAFITALLKLTRMKLTGRLEAERFSLRNCIFNSLTTVQSRAQSKSIVVSHQIDPVVDEVVGEAVLIEGTLTNILFNAVKYTPEGGRVSMAVKQDGAFVEVSIADAGIGIPEADLAHIFQEFYRADNARAIERDGTGLGLAFAKQVIERHGVDLGAEQSRGRHHLQLHPSREQTGAIIVPRRSNVTRS